jgi:hypothetical protein
MYVCLAVLPAQALKRHRYTLYACTNIIASANLYWRVIFNVIIKQYLICKQQ